MGDSQTPNGCLFPRGFSTATRFPWPLVRAEELVVLNYGKALREGDRRPGGIRVYGTNGQCGWHDTRMQEGPGVILGRKGQGPLGVEWCDDDYWVIDTAYFITPKTDTLDLKYFYYLVKYIGLNHLKDGTSNPSLSRDTFNSLLLPFPPISAQQAIVRVLGTLDDKIGLNRRMNEALEATARAIFKSWFVDSDPVRAKIDGRKPLGMDAATAALFPGGFEETVLGCTPQGWQVKALPEVIEVNPRRVLPKGTVSPYLDMKNMPMRGHCPDEVIDRTFSSGTKFSNGDTLLARITPCLENGKTAFVDFLRDGEVGWGSTEYIVFHPKPPLPAEFGYYLARSDDLRSFAIQNMTGTSGRQRVPPDCFNQYLLAVPPEPIARRFGDLVRPLVRQISADVRQSKSLAVIRDTLLPKLLSGKLRVKEAEEPVEVRV